MKSRYQEWEFKYMYKGKEDKARITFKGKLSDYEVVEWFKLAHKSKILVYASPVTK